MQFLVAKAKIGHGFHPQMPYLVSQTDTNPESLCLHYYSVWSETLSSSSKEDNSTDWEDKHRVVNVCKEIVNDAVGEKSNIFS